MAGGSDEKLRKYLLDTLKQSKMLIVFDKADGTRREMKCSLHESYLPPQQSKAEVRRREGNKDVIACWDIEKEGWRSFRVDSVVSYMVI